MGPPLPRPPKSKAPPKEGEAPRAGAEDEEDTTGCCGALFPAVAGLGAPRNGSRKKGAPAAKLVGGIKRSPFPPLPPPMPPLPPMPPPLWLWSPLPLPFPGGPKVNCGGIGSIEKDKKGGGPYGENMMPCCPDGWSGSGAMREGIFGGAPGAEGARCGCRRCCCCGGDGPCTPSCSCVGVRVSAMFAYSRSAGPSMRSIACACCSVCASATGLPPRQSGPGPDHKTCAARTPETERGREKEGQGRKRIEGDE